jgi:hypothetical protein
VTPRRRLVFFTGKDPHEDTRPTWTAYHFALVAAGAGLDAEVRLAGQAVGALQDGGVPEGSAGVELREKMRVAVEQSLFVSG